jgi:hypothetical protein
MTIVTKSQIIAELTTMLAPRSAWERGVLEYAREMLECLGTDASVNRDTVRRVVLDGAADAREYSEGGCALTHDRDIAERLCTPSELKRKKGGDLPPSRTESWLDMQTRAIHQALALIDRAAKRAA